MTKVSLDSIKALRQQTGASINDCRQALANSGGDSEKAREFLRQRGAAIAEKRQVRAAGQGRIEAYIHHDGRLGSIVEVNCESDFVARTPEFIQFCKDVAMQVVAKNPRFVSVEEASDQKSMSDEDKKALCLLEQPFIKDEKISIGDLLKSLIAKTGEKVVIRRFAQFTLGANDAAC
ncbi:MAG: elongation factor Ts [Candidatus Omnitrophica bacterium]|nr:elongation factor Ts [Candidatus Omnitrophota bacterium]MBI2175051.1 elongation factor Ts [Candidatus Omnitrophota bacterium]MBI3009524.1 elongation factor Ts [Candidatus Omnitrophota bacterium]